MSDSFEAGVVGVDRVSAQESAVSMSQSSRKPRSAWRRRELLRLLPAAAAFCLIGGISLARGTVPSAPDPAARQPDAPLRFLAIADSGSGNSNQRAVADRMAELHGRQPVDLVVMGGDNIYPDGNLGRAKKTFSDPYRSLLTSGVPFHAVLGNHDIRTANGTPQVTYQPFGMKGRWYTLRRGPVEFFMLDTNVNADWGRQLPWLTQALASSVTPWKVVVGHHPIYSAGHYGNDKSAIRRLTPLFQKYGVQLYINGHEHNYERTKPINGTTYLIVGGAGAWLRPVRPNSRTAKAISTYSFAELQANQNQLTIQAWDLKGKLIDRAVLQRRAGA